MLKKLTKWGALLSGSVALATVGGCDVATQLTDLINQILGGVLPQ